MSKQLKKALLDRLAAISPMPDDDKLEDHVLEEYTAIIDELEPIADESCMGALIASFGYGYGYEVYGTTVNLLGKMPEDALHDALIPALKTGSPGPRMWAAYMLGLLRRPSDVDLLISVLKDPLDLIRAHAVKSLRKIGDRRAKPALEKLREDPSKDVRIAVRDALADLEAT